MILAMAATPIAMLHHDHELGAAARVRTLARAPVPSSSLQTSENRAPVKDISNAVQEPKVIG